MSKRASAVLFFCIGLILIATAVLFGIEDRAFIQNSVTAEASVTQMGGSGRRRQPVVTFVTADGVRAKATLYGLAGHREGDSVRIRYLREAPYSAREDAWYGLWSIPIITGGMGLLFCLATLGGIFKRSPAASPDNAETEGVRARAQAVAQEQGWPWLEPVEISPTTLPTGERAWAVRTNAQARGASVRLVLRASDGAVVESG